MKKNKIILFAAILLLVTHVSAHAASIMWASTTDWVTNATSGSIPFKNGSVTVTISGSGITSDVLSSDPYVVNTTTRYDNIDTADNTVLRVSQANSNLTQWDIDFYLVNTVLTAGDVFTIGQLGLTAAGAAITDLSVTFFAADGTTVVNPADPSVEQHAPAAPGFGAPLLWDPATLSGSGALSVTGNAADTESVTAFFGPSAQEIGRIKVVALTNGMPDAIDFGFGSPVVVPVPAAAWLFGSGLLALVGAARRRRHLFTV